VAERRRGVPRTSERLGRMLVVVPYLVQHPGAELQEVARLFDVPIGQLRKDLDLLFMSGLPPYGPGDLIDVEVDEDDRIWIRMADHFARPLRLTRSEALALYLRGTELVATPGLPEAPALASALARLREELGPETLDAAGRIETASAGRPPAELERLRAASRGHERLEIDYFAGSTGEWSTRRIDPEEVFSSMGNWYVAAWDADVDA
jgi:predicted DNA-binding transcriptional regulator YafY